MNLPGSPSRLPRAVSFPVASTSRRKSHSRLASWLGFFSLVLLAGCGFWVTGPLPIVVIPPPGGPPPTSSQHGTITITPQYVALAPGQSFQFTATSSTGGTIAWFVNNVPGGNATVGTVTSTGDYTAPANVSQVENIQVTAALASAPLQDNATAVVAIILPGTTLCPPLTGHPLVAVYTTYLPAPGKVSVEFGTTTNYGFNTWQQSTPSNTGGQVTLEVGGMRGNTTYHLRGQIALDNGATFNDADFTCTTGTPPATSPIQITTPGGGTPQPGIEIWNTLFPHQYAEALATDLQGNVIWTYTFQGTQADLLQGIQLLPNGHFLTLISYLSSNETAGAQPGIINEVREIDLLGNTIRSLNMTQLNQKLAASSLRDASGNIYQLGSFHHNVLALPNGHWILLATDTKTETIDVKGQVVTVPVIGDALVDVDQNLTPVWAWNTFDHLDVNRHPMNCGTASCDWTHSNDMLYSSDDHNLLLSMRHQNWIIKIEYLDGQGSGNILWHLGYQGDFKLIGATDPTDWFYAQHGMNYFTPNTTGVFRIGLMDNGNDRTFPPPIGQVLCSPAAPPSPTCYSTMPLLELNESNMTATMITHYVPADTYFSFFGGNADLLENNDLEVDFSAPQGGAIVQELNPQATSVIWQGITPGAYQFHVDRMPSLYPGVQW